VHFLCRRRKAPGIDSRGLWQQCGSSRPRKGLLHRCGGLIAYVRQHVGVGVEGFGYGRMPKHLGDDLRVHVAGKQQRGARVGVGRESGPAAAPPASGGLNLMCIGVSRPLALPQRCAPGRCPLLRAQNVAGAPYFHRVGNSHPRAKSLIWVMCAVADAR